MTTCSKMLYNSTGTFILPPYKVNVEFGRFVIALILIFNSDPNPTEMIDYSSGKGTRYDDLGRDIKADEFQHHGEFGITFKIVA